MQLGTHQRALLPQRLLSSLSIAKPWQLPNGQPAVFVPCCEADRGVATAAAATAAAVLVSAATAAVKLLPKQHQRHGHAKLFAVRRLQDCQTATGLREANDSFVV